MKASRINRLRRRRELGHSLRPLEEEYSPSALRALRAQRRPQEGRRDQPRLSPRCRHQLLLRSEYYPVLDPENTMPPERRGKSRECLIHCRHVNVASGAVVHATGERETGTAFFVDATHFSVGRLQSSAFR